MDGQDNSINMDNSSVLSSTMADVDVSKVESDSDSSDTEGPDFSTTANDNYVTSVQSPDASLNSSRTDDNLVDSCLDASGSTFADQSSTHPSLSCPSSENTIREEAISVSQLGDAGSEIKSELATQL